MKKLSNYFPKNKFMNPRLGILSLIGSERRKIYANIRVENFSRKNSTNDSENNSIQNYKKKGT
jgi:hypothetical protein